MMNHHLPAMPHGQPPIPAPRRQQDIPYVSGPPNMRSPPAYMGYPPQMNGHPPPGAYPPQQYPQWYAPYPPMQMPPRPHFNPYATPFISSYPHQQPLMAPAHMPPQSLPLQPRTATPFQNPMSPSVGPALAPVPPQSHSPIIHTVHSTPDPVPASSPGPMPLNTASSPKDSFHPPLPWLSMPESPFPARAPRKQRRGRNLQASGLSVELPLKASPWNKGREEAEQVKAQANRTQTPAQPASEPQTPTISGAPSLADSTQPTTPSSTVQGSTARPQSQTRGSKAAVPVVPVVPVKPAPTTPRSGTTGDTTLPSKTPKSASEAAVTSGEISEAQAQPGGEEIETKPVEPVKPVAPKSWADLVRNKNLARNAANQSAPVAGVINGAGKSQSVADVITTLGDDVSQYGDKVSFIEPRGLVNTGNMCYMNSVLQVLVSCVPFYQFMDHIGKRASHSFQSDFPMIDALIMFMKEFRVIDAADNEEQLRMRLKANEIEQYGDAFVPEFVYEVIRQLPRFRDMRRGHQQDAQEFLGFLLEEMHEECARADIAKPSTSTAPSTESDGDGWLEVGHKQKAATTQSSGHHSSQSPITKIFGGQIRSEFRVPGNKPSVTFEPYQPLQLDIGAPEVHNIVDALRHLAKSESIHGVVNSSGGPHVTATKQVFIDTLPPVLILHLKRFQYDSVTQGTQKIWKKIGYPLDLELPREVFPPHRRNVMMAQGGLPKYRLISVIYHHGKNASGGHYTVDVRRQEGREWMRLDDTVIRRIKSEDVAEAGGEEDPKVLAAALEQHKRDKEPTNIYDHIDQGDNSDDERGWSQVSGAGSAGQSSKKSASGAVGTPSQSGASSGVRTPLGRYGTRDNKVAYLLFYERIP
ncbi:hypothetical protein BDV18DRAFT_28041 [Aspergillus unguis]